MFSFQLPHLGVPGGRPFRLLLTGLAVSSCGDWLYNVALLALVFGRTHSATMVALTTGARVAPVVVLGPIGGVLADRHDRRRLMLASDLTRAALMLALAAAAVAGLPMLLAPVLAAAASAAGVVQPPCVAACTARLVADADRQRANAIRSATGQAAIVVGPALGAAVLFVSSPTAAIALNAVTFLLSALAVARVGAGAVFAPPPAAGGRSTSVLAELRSGARALRGAPIAIRLVAADALCSTVYGLLTVTLIMVSQRDGAGSDGYGLLIGAYGAGGLLGAALLARTRVEPRWRRSLTVALGLVAVTLAGLGLAPSLAAALALALLGGGGMVVGEVLSETALPRVLDDALLARAYGLVFPASIGGIVVGSLVAGPLVDLLGLAGALLGAGAAVLTIGALLVASPLTASTARADAVPGMA